jgi:hypothetical protein
MMMMTITIIMTIMTTSTITKEGSNTGMEEILPAVPMAAMVEVAAAAVVDTIIDL